MVFGGGEDGAFNKELLQFNEDTLWSGQPRDGNIRDAKNHLAAIRAAVLEQQDYHLADQLCRKTQGLFAESYQPLGNLRLDLTHSGPAKNFRRQLDLDTACVTVSYEVEGVQFQRKAFVSAPDQVLVLRVTGSKPHQISGVLTLDGPLQQTLKALTDNRLLLTGKAAATSRAQATRTANSPSPSQTSPAPACISPPWSRFTLKAAPQQTAQTQPASPSPTQPHSRSS